MEEAIACYQAALLETTRSRLPLDWASTQNNLGNAYSDRIKGERSQNMEEAIACYQAALLETTRSRRAGRPHYGLTAQSATWYQSGVALT